MPLKALFHQMVIEADQPVPAAYWSCDPQRTKGDSRTLPDFRRISPCRHRWEL